MVGLYLLYGKENFLKDEFVQSLKDRFFPKGDGLDFNYQEFDVAEEPFHKASDFLKTAPFLAEKRLAVFRHVDALEAEEKEALLKFAQNKMESAVAVFTTEESNTKKNSFLKDLAELCQCVACHVPFEKDFPVWVENRAKKKGLTIQKDASLLLIDRFGRDLAGLDASLESLSLYAHPKKDITSAHVENLIGRSAASDSFVLMDSLISGNGKQALRQLTDILRDGGRAYEVVGAIGSQLEKLKKTSYLLESGRSAKDIGFDLKINPFFIDRQLRQARALTKERAGKMLDLLMECDQAVKRGILSDRLALYTFCIKIST